MYQMSNIEKEIIKNIENNFMNKIDFPEYSQLMLYLHNIFAYTGQFNIMYCNSFIQESVQLLKNALILYKKGFFDCAFYSIRQSSEVIDNMLFLAKSPKDKLKEWKSKEYFPVDAKIRKQLKQLSEDYNEIKTLLPDFFNHHEELINKIHKIIHKQGYDTFYQLRTPINVKFSGFVQEKETKLFLETLKYTIGKLLILLVVLDPMCLALSDERVIYKVSLKLMTEPIDTSFFEEVLELDDIIDKIKNSNYYKNFISFFDDKEELLPATYSVIQETYWNIDKLDEIQSQLHLLSMDEVLMFNILKSGIKISIFYLAGGWCWYTTSNTQIMHEFSINTRDFQNYAQATSRFNQNRKNVYISVLKYSPDDFLFVEHNTPLNTEEINILLNLEKQHLEYVKMCQNEVNKILDLE